VTTAASFVHTVSPVSGPTLLADANVALGGWRTLVADDAGGQNVSTAQPWFPSAGGVTLIASETYRFYGRLWATRTAGVTSHTTAVLFGGAATLNSITYWAEARTGDANALASTNGFRATSNAALVIKAASTSATEDLDIFVEGIVRINAGGSFIPQFQYSVAPGGTPTIKQGTHFVVWPLNPVSPLSTDDRTGSPYVWA
jgi:hypothetical protein